MRRERSSCWRTMQNVSLPFIAHTACAAALRSIAGMADAVADDERSFLIDEALQFRFGSLDGDATCAWRDLSGDDGDLWEFVSSRVSVAEETHCAMRQRNAIADQTGRSESYKQLVRTHHPQLHVRTCELSTHLQVPELKVEANKGRNSTNPTKKPRKPSSKLSDTVNPPLHVQSPPRRLRAPRRLVARPPLRSYHHLQRRKKLSRLSRWKTRLRMCPSCTGQLPNCTCSTLTRTSL